MAKWASASTQDGGTDLWRSLSGTAARVKQHLIKAYTVGDSYATVTGNSLGSVDMVTADFVQTSASNNRVCTVPQKSITTTANSGPSPDLHIALVDSVSGAVLFVTDETTNQVVTSGNIFNVPSWAYTVNQVV